MIWVASLFGQQIDLQIKVISAIYDSTIRFCLINTNAVSNTASSEVIVDNRENGTDRRGQPGGFLRN
jgi:hypothetical protein